MFIVVFDDEGAVCAPYGWDSDCEGALAQAIDRDDPVAVFDTRQDAKKAIEISRRYGLLCKAQGKPVNDDFTDPKYAKCIRIKPLKPKGA